MNVLIIHHLESIWESGYNRYGESFEGLCEKVLDYLSSNHFQKVILTRFEDDRLEDIHCYTGLSSYINEVQIYGYGWSKDDFDGDWCEDGYDDDWCEGETHSEIVYLAPWMKELKGTVSICGAFDGECIEDLEVALTHLNVNYKRIEELII